MFPELEAGVGGIGTAEQIFDMIIEKKITTAGILVSPPSSIYLHAFFVKKSKRFSRW